MERLFFIALWSVIVLSAGGIIGGVVLPLIKKIKSKIM